MLTIAIVNEKGGTGKTTTAVNLSAALGELGKSVLLVDLDGQAASSRWLGVEDDCRFADALWRGEGLEPIRNLIPGVSLAPGSGKLDSVAHDLRPTQGGQLRKLLCTLTEFDFAVIDCPPSLGNRLIGNALLAASHAVVPVETSILAMDGLKILLTTLQDIKDGFDHDVQLTGVVACRFDARTKLSRFILDELKRALPDKVFNTVIRENVRLRECPGSGKSILEYAPDSHAAEDYRSLAKECLVRLGQNERISPQQFQAVSDLREQVESLVRKFSDPGSPQESAAKESPDATAAPLESQAALSPPTEDVIVFDDSAEPFDAAAQPALAEATPHAAQDPAPDDGLALVVPVVEGVGGADISEADDEQPEEQQLEEQPAEAVITAADPPADRFEELSPYANPPVEPEDGSEPESDAEAASDEPVEELPPPEEPLVPIQPVAAAPAPAPDRAMSPAEIARAAEGQAAKAQDFPALRAMLQNLAVERPAPKPAGKPPKKESPWRKMMRAVGVQR